MRTIADLMEKARKVSIQRVVERRGIKLRGRIDQCGPCPRCGGRDRFSINVKKQVWNCRRCGVGGDVIALIQHLDGCSFAAAVETLAGERSATRASMAPRRPGSPDLYERQQHQKAAWLWSRGQPIPGTIAEKYLRARGITCPLPVTLRYLAPAKAEHRPAMMAAFGIADEPEPGVLAAPRLVDAVHLTLLKPDGTAKADTPKPKIVIARPLGRAVSIAPANDLLGLAVTEGIEDGLSVFEATGLGVWVAGSAPLMPAVGDLIPQFVNSVTIYAHSDDVGQDGAHKLAWVLLQRGIEVLVEGLRHG